jgi:uncharacterized protein HemX
MEITLYIILGLSILLNIVLFYRGYKLVEQIERYQQRYIDVEDDAIQTFDKMLDEMRKLDIRGSFESDDEVGVVFKELKDVIEKYKNNF